MKLNQEVLIVGGGPSGLILANELLRRRVPVRVIEKRPGPSHTTRAMTVHARSMEMFEHMGLAHRLEEVCLECPGNIYHFPHLEEKDQPRTDYRTLPTRFAFYYKINQNDFEQVLREHLFSQYSLRPEYHTELVGLIQIGDYVEATIRMPNGTEERLLYPWAVGCDGVRSFVREAAGITFPGDDVAAMAMMDVQLEHVTFDDRWMNYYFDKDLFMNCTKLPGKNWRIYMSEPTGDYVFAKDQRKAFQEVADRLKIGFTIGEPEWATTWQIRNNIAERYRNGHAMICGDASHVHSPSGGQGMNGCMQDAFNLGWKLASVWHRQSEESILDSYERERKPIGEQISQGAMATHEIVMGFGIDPKERYHLTQEEGWEERTTHLVSGLSHNYAQVVKIPSGLSVVSGPQAGERAPDAMLVEEPRKRLYDVLRHPGFSLLIVPGSNRDSDLAFARQVKAKINEQFPDCVETVLISEHSDHTFDADHYVSDDVKEFADRYKIQKEGRFIIVRPDIYIGMTCLPKEADSLVDYLQQWFHSANAAVSTENRLELVNA